MHFFGDTAFGQTVRALSGGRWFAHQETSDQLGPGWLARKPSDFPDDASLDKSNNPSTPVWLAYVSRWDSALQVAARAGSETPSGESSSSSSLRLLSDAEVPRDGLVTWYGDDDPENPRNWTTSEKVLAVATINLYTFTVYLGSAIFTASIPGVMQQYGVSYAAASLGLALFVFGYGAGAMLFSPLSEIPSLGRNWIYVVTLVMYLAFTIGTAVVDNYGGLITLRFLAGFVGAPALATGGATLSDMLDIVKFPYAIALWVAAASMGPALGPVMGGFAATAKSWRWPMWIQVWLVGPVLILMLLTLPETSATNILARRARRLRKLTGNQNLRSEGEIEQHLLSPSKMVVESLFRPIQIAILDPGCGFVNIYVSLVYAIYYSFFESFPLVYIDIYGFSLGTMGLTFVSVVVTTVIGAAGYIFYIYYSVEPKIRREGLPSLESRLIPAIPASVLMPIGLFLFAWTSRASVHWFVGLVGVGIYSIGFYVMLQCALLYVPLMYPKYAASLLAANDFCRSSLAAAFVMAGRPMFVHLGIGGGVSLLAGLTCLCIPALLALYKYNPRLRAKSKFTDVNPGMTHLAAAISPEPEPTSPQEKA